MEAITTLQPRSAETAYEAPPKPIIISVELGYDLVEMMPRDLAILNALPWRKRFALARTFARFAWKLLFARA